MLEKLEDKYETSDEFRSQMRLAIEKIKVLDVSPASKIHLMRKVEDTYQLHSRNYTALNSIMDVLSSNQRRMSGADSGSFRKPSPDERKIPGDYRNNDPFRITFDISLD